MKKMLKIVKRYRLFYGAVLASVIALPMEIFGWHTAAHYLVTAVLIIELMPLSWEMFRDIRSGKYGVDILAATAILSSAVLGQYWAGMVIVLMLTGGKGLESYAEGRANRELKALLTRAPQKAHVIRGRREVEVKASEVRTGDKIIIKPGELVPVDAIILEGVANFDESSLTGESLPQSKQAGDDLLSGAINVDGVITAKALRSASDSQYQQIIKLVQGAQNSQAPFVRLADRYAIPFTIFAFIVAIGAWVISHEAIRFLEVIVVATPCPLILAAPIAIISGMSRSAKHGIIIKTGSALEKLATARTFGFDKTGTLTRGELYVEHITTYNSLSRNEILALAAGLEQNSNHALAQAIIRKAAAENLKLAKIKNVREIAGKGMVATGHGQEIVVGNLGLLEDYNIKLPKAFKASNHDQTAAFVAVDGSLAGVIALADEIREESKRTIQQLRDSGVRNFMMVTGDNKRVAHTIAKQLGIDEVVPHALPGDKIRAVEAIKERPVAFVGDGVNDAPVLTASDVGIALGARGATAASESADIVIMLDDLSRLATSVQIAQRTFSIAKQSIFIGIALSAGLMLIFATGKFLPIYGAAIQEVVDVIVIFNALRAHSGGHNPIAK
ncbi:MAG TPA: heavy metal translocating P-type ATPase [Patescibacteria group bacterium]|nr:heavy metal translocating P-type ATPase [Patescibacteria group bacterium]